MKSVSGRDFARVVERRGWSLLRISGSHHIYGKSGSVCTAVNSDSRQQAAEDGLVAALGKARGTLRRRSLAPDEMNRATHHVAHRGVVLCEQHVCHCFPLGIDDRNYLLS